MLVVVECVYPFGAGRVVYRFLGMVLEGVVEPLVLARLAWESGLFVALCQDIEGAVNNLVYGFYSCCGRHGLIVDGVVVRDSSSAERLSDMGVKWRHRVATSRPGDGPDVEVLYTLYGDDAVFVTCYGLELVSESSDRLLKALATLGYGIPDRLDVDNSLKLLVHDGCRTAYVLLMCKPGSNHIDCNVYTRADTGVYELRGRVEVSNGSIRADRQDPLLVAALSP